MVHYKRILTLRNIGVKFVKVSLTYGGIVILGSVQHSRNPKMLCGGLLIDVYLDIP